MTKQHILDLGKDVKLVKNVLIPMRDGVRLAADLYMPTSTGQAEQFPVVLEYTPYRKDEIDYNVRDFYLILPRSGYVVARLDVRGTGASEGVSLDEYTRQEQLDGYDAIEWLAQQPWCDGHVNMMGISYGGFTALQVAAHNPPHLTSIIPVDFTDDRYTDDCHYRGGLLRKYYDIGDYGAFMVARNALPLYPDWSGADWARIWKQHLKNNEPYLLEWFRHQTDGEYWRQGSVRDIPDQIQCPVFMIGGWRDGYPNPPLRLYQALAHVPRKVLIGPWNHAMPDVAIPGPRLDYLPELVRWLDYWCKGQETGIMDEPPVVVYMQRYQPPLPDRLDTPGEWRAETSWPPPDAETLTLYLGDNNTLDEKPPATLANDSFEYNPTVGVAGGLWSGGFQFGLPGDQRPDEALSLTYTTSPLTEDVYLLGWPQAILYLSSSAAVIGFSANLSDVAPDGTSHLVAKGMVNATRRESLGQPKRLEPGEIFELDIQIDCTGWIFEKGHQIRLSIASADWPNVWPTPEPAINHVYRGPQHPSRLILPIVPATGSAAPPRFRPSAKQIGKHTAALKPPTWVVSRDLVSGRTTVEIGLVSEFRPNESTLFHRESISTFQVDPRDPAHANGQARHLYRIVRPNHQTQSQADVAVQATATHFQISIDLEVRINDALHFTRHWAESVPRHLL